MRYSLCPIRGFTLIELLVAMVVFTVIAGACWALLDAGRGVSAHGALEADRCQAGRAALRAIESDLRGAFITVDRASLGLTGSASAYDKGLVGVSGGAEDRPLDTLTLVSWCNQPSPATTEKEMDLAQVSYSIDQDGGTEQAGLVREKRKRITETVTVVEPGVGVEEIAKDVVGLNLRYYDGNGWLDAWDSTTSGALPKAIEATVYVKAIWRGVEEVDPFTTRIYLPLVTVPPKKTP